MAGRPRKKDALRCVRQLRLTPEQDRFLELHAERQGGTVAYNLRYIIDALAESYPDTYQQALDDLKKDGPKDYYKHMTVDYSMTDDTQEDSDEAQQAD